MRLGVTLNIGGVAQVQEHPPTQYQYQYEHQQQHYVPPPTAAVGWKSPVPYLFGGLAAMLGLIAFALLILACSYWKLSGHLDAGDNSGDISGEGKSEQPVNATTAKFQNSIFVIMAGEEKPTFVATPATSRTTSFGDSECDNNGSCSSSSSSSNSDDENRREKVAVTMMSRTGTNCDEEEKS